MAAGRIVIPSWMPALDSNGFPIPNAQMYFYLNETTTLATIYADMDLSVPLPNPVVANSSGQFPAIWADDANLFSVSVDAPYGPPGIPFTFDGIWPSTTATASAVNKADKDGANIDPVAEALPFNAKLEEYRRPFDKPLMDFVTDINAADWKPYFDAAVDWAAANAPSGVRFLLPRNVVDGGIPLSYVKPILSDGVYFVGKGRNIWTGSFTANNDTCDIKLLASGGNPVFTWGDNSFEAGNPDAPAGFVQKGGGLMNLNIRGWLSDGALAVTKGVVNPKFNDLWVWVLHGGIRIENGYDPEIQRVHLEAYETFGIEVNGTGVGTAPKYSEGRGDRGVFRDILIAGQGDEAGPTSIGPAFAIRGFWHTAMCSNIQVVKGGGAVAEGSVFVGERRNGSAIQRPMFISFIDLQIDFVKSRCLVIDDVEDCWISTQLYLNSSPYDQVYIGPNAKNINIHNIRGYGSESRMVTVAGKDVTFLGGDLRNWNRDPANSEPAVYLAPTCEDVKFIGTTFGDVGLDPGDGSAGHLAVYTPPASTFVLTMIGCSFFGLATTPIDYGNTQFASIAAGADSILRRKLGVQANTLPGTTSLALGGDITIGGAAPTLMFNLYYDGASWRYNGNGPGSAIRVVLDGSTPKIQLLTAPNNTGGAGAAATVTVAGYLTATP